MTVNLGQSEAHLSGRVVTRVAIRARQVDFRRWMPEMGRVFDKAFAFRGKGTPVDRARPWMPTAIAIAAACDGRRGYLISRGDLAEFLAAHEQQTLIVHDAAGELDALDVAVPGLDIYRRSTPTASRTSRSSIDCWPWRPRATPIRSRIARDSRPSSGAA